MMDQDCEKKKHAKEDSNLGVLSNWVNDGSLLDRMSSGDDSRS